MIVVQDGRDLANRMVPKRSMPSGEIYEKTTLRNGLRVVTETIPSVRSITLGVWVDVGSRSESTQENGVSHLIEHMLFKGTRTRSAKEIASALESIGGSLNAFTSREQTCYTARILDEHLEIAVDILSDMTCRPTLTPINIKREKMVIAEEIKESHDNPADFIHDLFAETFWNGHSLGRPILGSIENLMGMPRKRIVDYIRDHYLSGSVVISAAGSISHKKLVKLVKTYFEFPEGFPVEVDPASNSHANRNRIETDDNQQTHICIGHPGVPFADKDRTAAVALSTYLGGGMSSVLFQKVREQKGLAYSVYTYNDFYRDAGIFGTYIGTDDKHLVQAIDIVMREYNRLKRQKLTPSQVDQLKAQMKGQVTLAMESTSSRMNRLGRQELMLGRFVPLSDTLDEIDRINARHLSQMADRFFEDSTRTIAVLGPVSPGALDGYGT